MSSVTLAVTSMDETEQNDGEMIKFCLHKMRVENTFSRFTYWVMF